MMKYCEMIANIRSNPLEREEIEWTNFWRDSANADKNNRVLLIGDSNARILRGSFGDCIKRPVDLFATSSGLHDSLFVNQLDCFFASEEFKYTDIFIQLGHHAEFGADGDYFSDEDYDLYEKEFALLVDFLKQKAENVVVESVFYTVFPNKRTLINRAIRKPEKYNDTVNARKARKNAIMKKVAEDKKVKFCDINGYMLKEGTKYRHYDDIHYEERAKAFIVKEMAEYLK